MAATTTTKPLTGRRKEAVARVRLVPGSGKAMINGREIRDYLTRDSLVLIALRPLAVTNTAGAQQALIPRHHTRPASGARVSARRTWRPPDGARRRNNPRRRLSWPRSR